MNNYIITVTGHRAGKLKGGWNNYNLKNDLYQEMYSKMFQVAEKILEKHDTLTIRTGMALGADTVWGFVGVNLKKKYKNKVILEAHIPTKEVNSKWKEQDKKYWYHIINHADTVKVYDQEYKYSSMTKRDNGMIYGKEYNNKKCDLLLAIYDGSKDGGTYRAFKKAKKEKINVKILPGNFYENTFLN